MKLKTNLLRFNKYTVFLKSMKTTNIVSHKNILDSQNNTSIRVHHFNRNPGVEYSIEIVFNQIRNFFPKYIKLKNINSTYPNSGLFKKIWNLIEVLLKEKGEINHVTGDVHYLSIFLPKKGSILTIHDLNLMYTKKGLTKFIHKWFWLILPISRAQVITAISETTKTEILKYVKCDPDKIKVIYNCISPKFQPFPKAFNSQEPVLLQVGTRANKNIVNLAKALENIDCHLQIIGKPTEEALHELELRKVSFEWISNLTEEQLIEKYKQCDMLTFISTYEGFGLPIIEAQYIERPIITSSISSMPEIAGDGALKVDPYDVSDIRNGIQRIISSKELREMLIEQGRKNRTRFSNKEVAKEYLLLYQSVIGKNMNVV